jgi:4-carboxymuconolactone decarboxylase
MKLRTHVRIRGVVDDDRSPTCRPYEETELKSPEQEYVDGMVRSRGYVLDYHKYLAKADYPALSAANNLVDGVYLSQRSLDRRTKELLFILSLTVMRASKPHIKSHIEVALRIGLSPAEILEAMEIALPEAGIVAFQTGFEAWCEATGAEPLEPSPDVIAGLNGGPELDREDATTDGIR